MKLYNEIVKSDGNHKELSEFTKMLGKHVYDLIGSNDVEGCEKLLMEIENFLEMYGKSEKGDMNNTNEIYEVMMYYKVMLMGIINNKDRQASFMNENKKEFMKNKINKNDIKNIINEVLDEIESSRKNKGKVGIQITMKELKSIIMESIEDIIGESELGEYNNDPTYKEMKEYLTTLYKNEEGFEEDMEVAIYYFARDYYDGQSSNLYSVLSTSKYRPGPNSKLENDGMIAIEMYKSLENKFIGVEDEIEGDDEVDIGDEGGIDMDIDYVEDPYGRSKDMNKNNKNNNNNKDKGDNNDGEISFPAEGKCNKGNKGNKKVKENIFNDSKMELIDKIVEEYGVEEGARKLIDSILKSNLGIDIDSIKSSKKIDDSIAKVVDAMEGSDYKGAYALAYEAVEVIIDEEGGDKFV